MSTMHAWHNDPSLKTRCIEQMKASVAASEGATWGNGRGFTIGRTLKSCDRGRYESELGIPCAVESLEDVIAEMLGLKRAKAFTLSFAESIEPDADLSLVADRLMLDMLTDEKYGLIQLPGLASEMTDAIAAVVAAYRRRIAGDELTSEERRQVNALVENTRNSHGGWAVRYAWAAWGGQDALDAGRAIWSARDAWGRRPGHVAWLAKRLIHHTSIAPIGAAV